RQDLLDHGDRNGESDRVRSADDRGVHADYFAAQIEQRAAGVAGIDGGVRLQEVAVHRLRTQRPLLRADDAGGDGRLQAERVPDGGDVVASLKLVAVYEDGR